MSTDVRTRNRWLVPSLSILFGLLYLGIGLAHRQWGFAIGGLVVMVAYAIGLLIFGRRNEAVGLLAGDLADERRAQIQLRAASTTGYLLTVVLVAATIWALAVESSEVGLLSGLCAVAGVGWIASIVWFSRRS